MPHQAPLLHSGTQRKHNDSSSDVSSSAVLDVTSDAKHFWKIIDLPSMQNIGVKNIVGAGVLRKFGADFFFWLPSSRQTECSAWFLVQIFGAQIFAPISALIFAQIFGAQIFGQSFAQIFGAQIFGQIFAQIFRRLFFDVLALEK